MRIRKVWGFAHTEDTCVDSGYKTKCGERRCGDSFRCWRFRSCLLHGCMDGYGWLHYHTHTTTHANTQLRKKRMYRSCALGFLRCPWEIKMPLRWTAPMTKGNFLSTSFWENSHSKQNFLIHSSPSRQFKTSLSSYHRRSLPFLIAHFFQIQ